MTPPAARREELLFLMRNPAYVRNFEAVLSLLGERGRWVTVIFEDRKEAGDRAGLELIQRVCDRHESLSFEFEALPPLRGLGRLGVGLDALQDYLRYFDPPYGQGRRLRARSVARVPDRIERVIASALRRFPRGRRAIASAARHLRAGLPVDAEIRRELERRRPAAVIATPLVHFRSRQREWIRAAGSLGLGTMMCLHSWDNLTNRGLIHSLPDRVLVWNDPQREEVVELHGARPESVEVTGAWPYDLWFTGRPSCTRAEFCGRLGLASDEATILYVCSSRFIAERERVALARWLRAVRGADDPHLARANVVVRPHPLNLGEWGDPSASDLSGATIFPPRGADPTGEAARADYYDSIAHADAVVGVNTSAMVESTILNRPALAFPAPTFRSSQEELPHFRQIVGEHGAVDASASMEEHVAQLGRAIADPDGGSARRRRFVERFLRPRGGSPPPSERVAGAIEEMLDSRSRRPTAHDPANRMHA